MARKHFEWKVRDKLIQLGERTLIVGVLNVTPDSFSDGGKYSDPDRAFARAVEMEEEGADLIDIGAESTRPGSVRISEAEELPCQQFFMFPGSKGHCCEERRCKNPVKKSTDRTGSQTTPQDCQTMPLERASAAHSPSDLAAQLPAVPVPATDFIELARSHARAAIAFDPTAGSPPDIPVIDAALLI